MQTERLDLDALSPIGRTRLAAAGWNAVNNFLKRPDARAILDAEKERLLKEGSTLLDPRPKKLKGAKT